MKRFAAYLSTSALLFTLWAPVSASAAVTGSSHKGDIEFRVGSSTSTVIAGARVIVINHDGNIVATGLTNAQGTWDAQVPLYKADWNKKFDAKGVVNAIVIADGFNEQAVYIIPITEHTVQPVILQPIQANRRNAPSASLGNFSTHDLRRYIDRYASELKLKRQAPIPGDPEYAPWSPQQQQ
ncbi:hypothetical protein Alches_14950 [Alicyclobacillus hesperidum subsp. aegles]|uniref:carboxypeptidase-like regulatory domain-containing protein n=1 Tax=Alicyclobacillus hesperidum TaxID=89784 RepID=UPI00222A8AEA|nr:carboxypeptidase-like regulatory domain-containing protein [Alicyclobacillus hesperidum]GLG01456.1 hypothetical protein Alches_14950 [Alicyclobacillus hesperidum subsp. aegles]